MKTLPTQALGHLVVAAIRVVQLRLRHAPTDAGSRKRKVNGWRRRA